MRFEILGATQAFQFGPFFGSKLFGSPDIYINKLVSDLIAIDVFKALSAKSEYLYRFGYLVRF